LFCHNPKLIVFFALLAADGHPVQLGPAVIESDLCEVFLSFLFYAFILDLQPEGEIPEFPLVVF